MSCLANLPFGWVEATLGELGIGKTENIIPADFSDEIFELWSVPAFPTGMPELLTGSEIGSNKQRVQPGDVLLCKINPRINRVWKVGQKTKYTQIASTEWIALRIPEVESDFLVYRFREQKFRNALCADVSGVGGSLIRARPQSVEKLQITLPPLNEQRRIIAKIKALKARSQRVKQELEAIAPLLDQFRQSVLTAAFRGDLTADWRDKHPDVEPASVLLERIRAERRRCWEEAELEKMKAQGKTPKDDKWKDKYKEPDLVDDSQLPELPDGWCWVSLEEISYFVTDGDHNPPKKADRVQYGIPHLTAKNVVNWTLSEEECSYITEQDFERSRKRYDPLGGDVIVTCVGTLGRTAIVPQNYIFSADRNLAIIRLVKNGIVSQFLMLNLNTPKSQDSINKASGSTAQPHFYLADIRAFPVILTSIAEQEEIVRRIESLFIIANTIEQQYQEAKAHLNQLDRSILAKAFRGELVPQDPNDEPASVLLERIRAEREKLDTKKKAKGKTEKKSCKAQPEPAEPKQLSLPGFE